MTTKESIESNINYYKKMLRRANTTTERNRKINLLAEQNTAGAIRFYLSELSDLRKSLKIILDYEEGIK